MAILEHCYKRARSESSPLQNTHIQAQLELVSRNVQNRAGVRLLMACALAKLDQPSVDIRKPYTEIGDEDSFSGRTYDERFIGPFIEKHRLPCNPTTAFLTPAFRNRNTVLMPGLNLVGRPKAVYDTVLSLLQAVHEGQLDAETLLTELTRQLLDLRDERAARLESQLKDLSGATSTLSVHQVLTLIGQHLTFKNASRLPVLVVAAIYRTIATQLDEYILPLEAHNAADRQTQALGDLEITLTASGGIVAVYEIKARQVTVYDIDIALQKIIQKAATVENLILVTTADVADDVQHYAESCFQRFGIEVVILDCLGFLKHFLYLFYRQRLVFLDLYQALVLSESESAVNQALKEAFLALRIAAESQEGDDA